MNLVAPKEETMVKVAINGFGRIGRLALRVVLQKYKEEIEVVAINTSGSAEIDNWAYLFKYDTTYREFPGEVSFTKTREAKEATDDMPEIGKLIVSGKSIPVLAQRDPEKLPWKDFGVEVVVECTGVFTDGEGAKKHAKAGAKRVVISAPAKGSNVQTFVLGVNEYDGEGQVLSNASCTTNCIAPVAAVIHSKFGIEKAMMTTAHSFTNDQALQDQPHEDFRRGRAASQNIVPTTTGAAVAVTQTIPQLKGLFAGHALRVPTISGSITDMVFLLKKEVTVEEVNNALKEASQKPMYQGILLTTEEELVSSDIIGRSESSIVDLKFTQVVGGNMVKIFAWYDNEWGYANRLVEQVVRVGNSLHTTEAPVDEITRQFKNLNI